MARFLNINTLIVIAVILLIIAGVVELTKQDTGDLIRPPSQSVQDMGPAPDFTIDVLDGARKSLEDYRGKPIVLNFWASWCPPCRAEAADLVRIDKKYGDQVHFVGVIFQDNEADARKFMKEFGVEYENGLDPNGKAAQAYKITGIPTTVIIDANGVVRARWLGAIPAETLSSYIDGALAIPAK